jgi:hypothetical protein
MQDFVGFHHGGAKVTGRKLWYYPARQISECALKHGVEIDLDGLAGAEKRETSLCERRGAIGLKVCIPR